MFRALRITTVALLFVIIVALSGCTVLKEQPQQPTPAPTATSAPVPSKTPTVVPTATAVPGPATNATVEQQYKYTEMLQSGIDKYNAGIIYMDEAQRLAHNQSDWSNASSMMLKAKERMEAARADFETMGGFSINQDEVLLSEKWVQTANYSAASMEYASLAYAEMADQIATKGPGNVNPVKYNSFVRQANDYNALAMQSRNEAEALEKNLAFLLSGL
ncbi:hypothetical protein [Methanocella arvoryzae]|uniref:hypothetical protein n=1 Tax=Methanocella arvoryzae TaxID=1175445 RepID=UPI0011D19528|nr:hypothetical protein [Methanocella arvoryzae]